MRDYQKKAILNGSLVLLLLVSICMIAEAAAAERQIRPVRIETPQTTAKEAIVTGVCDFGGCPAGQSGEPETTEAETSQNLAATSQPEPVKESLTTERVSETYTLVESKEEPEPETPDGGRIDDPRCEVTEETESETETEPEAEPEEAPERSGRTVRCYVTAYCGCYECSEGYGNMTATGRTARPYHTIAVDPGVIPYGTQVEINGVTYTAEDCGGGINGYMIDVYFEEHRQCYDWDTGWYDVTIY